MGVIDVLTQYDTKKKAAHAAKAVKHGVRDQCFFKGLVSRRCIFYISIQQNVKGCFHFPSN